MKPSAEPPDLIFFNANLITLNAARPRAELLAVLDGRIMWVGCNSDLAALKGRNTRAIDCQGQTVVPGFIDSHCHLLAYASSLLAADCRPKAVSSVADIQSALGERARVNGPGEWVRGTGYSEFDLDGGRHPSRRDLDEAVPDRPVRLNHRSGHACVLNSVALARAGLSRETPDPAAGVIERDLETGEPTGLLMDMDEYLEAVIPPLEDAEIRRGVQLASQRLVSAGITSAQDATHTNSVERWDALSDLKSDGALAPRITMLAGSDQLDGLLDRGLRFGSGDVDLSLGAVKIMLTATTGRLTPSPEELRAKMITAHDAGFPVAIHAVEAEAVQAAADALIESWPPGAPRIRGTRDRIEHCSECPPDSLEKLRRSGTIVVTQPGFIYESGRRYLSEVPPEVQPWLYRINSFETAGLRPAAGSDAPVAEPNPLLGIYSAVTRRARTGETVGEPERVRAELALQMFALSGAYAAFQEDERGSLEMGKLADLALLDGDPLEVEPEVLRHINVVMTVIGGKVVWEA